VRELPMAKLRPRDKVLGIVILAFFVLAVSV